MFLYPRCCSMASISSRKVSSPSFVLGRVAAGGVREDREAVERQVIEEVLLGRVRDVHPPDRHRDDLRPGGLDRTPRLGEGRVLAGADDQARAILAPGEDEGVLHPPPTKLMISTASPWRSTVAAYSARGTTARFTSTAIRRGPRPSAVTRSATVAPSLSSRGSSFTTTCTLHGGR